MAQAYTPADYAEKNRRWSVLREMRAQLFPDWSLDTAKAAVSQFLTGRPGAEFRRPAAVCEKVSGERIGGVGELKRRNLYRLVLYPQMEGAGAQADLDIWAEQVIDWLHGRVIPYYDYSSGTARRDGAFDFRCRYESDSVIEEAEGVGRRVLTIVFAVEV